MDTAAGRGVSELAAHAPPRAPTLREALRYWLHLGCMSFGGPAGQIAIMRRELVDERHWISEGRAGRTAARCSVARGAGRFAAPHNEEPGWRIDGKLLVSRRDDESAAPQSKRQVRIAPRARLKHKPMEDHP